MITNILSYWKTVALSLLTISVLFGCATSSPVPNRYVFGTAAEESDALSRSESDAEFVIRYRAIHFPDYLERPQIVTRISDYQLKVDEFNRWGIPLSSMSERELGNVLMTELPNSFFDVIPWQGQTNTDYLIAVNVVRLDGTPGGTVDLNVQWQVSSGNEANPIALKLHRYQGKTADTSYVAYIEAIERVISDMGKDIAAAIKADRK